MAPLLPRVVAELVGPLELLEFSGHLGMLALYTLLHTLLHRAGPAADLGTATRDDFRTSCALDALAFGSGLEAKASAVEPGAQPGGEAGEGERSDRDGARLSNSDAQEGARKGAPWWQRPPRTWPPRIDDIQLVVGDIVASYTAAWVCLDVLTAGREAEWTSEGSAIACAWIVGAAVTNAWDPTAVLPSLGLGNALACVARASVDFASSRVAFALVGAVLAGEAVDVQLLSLELALGTVAVALWRSLYMTTNQDRR